MSLRVRRLGVLLLPLLLALAGCEDAPSKPKAETTKAGADTKTAPAAGEEGASATTNTSEYAQLLAWLPPDPIAVAYDRLGQRLDAAVVSVVFGIPPKAADLLNERETLDEGLDVVFDGDGEPENWMKSSSLAYTVALSKTPYFVRPLTKPAAELGPLFEAGGFTKNTVEDVEIWLPGGSFPWRIALVGGGVVAFIPVDVPGAGLEPLTRAKAQQDSSVKDELSRTLADDPMIELVLFSAGPLVHYDVRQTLAQIQFALRRTAGPGTKTGYEGQIRLEPTGDVDECANELHERTYPEENQQVQALIAALEFLVAEGGVVGRLEITPDQVKHFVDR